MSATNNGGPAFPQAHHSISVSDAQGARELLGMSLRDWFAGMALQGIVGAAVSANLHHSAQTPDDEQMGKWAAGIADAALSALAREGKEAK